MTETTADHPGAARACGARVRRGHLPGDADRPAHLSTGGSAFGARRRWLLGAGVGKGSRVGLFFPNGVDWVIWWLAVSRIGAVAVPLSTMYTPAEIAKVMRLADIGLLVAPAGCSTSTSPSDSRRRCRGLAGQPPDGSRCRTRRICGPSCSPAMRTARGRRVGTTRPPPVCRDELLAAVEAEVSPADLAIMVHTSGSTADPKGVLHTHGTLVRQTSTWPSAIRAITGPRAPSADPVCDAVLLDRRGARRDGGAARTVTLLVMPRLDAGTALDLVERERATGIVGWPAFTQRLREHPTFASRDLSSAPMLRDGPLDIAMTDVPDGFPVHRTMSETAGGFAFTDIAIVDDDGATGSRRDHRRAARPRYRRHGRLQQARALGDLRRGRLVPHRRPGLPKDRPDPRLFYVGRTSELIKAAGANVSPLEVEAVIAGFDDVSQCVVVGVDDAVRGEEVCAVVVPAAADLDVESLAAHTREQLSAYKVPTRWLTATSDQIPTLPSGKLDRKALRALVVDGVLDSPGVNQ